MYGSSVAEQQCVRLLRLPAQCCAPAAPSSLSVVGLPDDCTQIAFNIAPAGVSWVQSGLGSQDACTNSKDAEVCACL